MRKLRILYIGAFQPHRADCAHVEGLRSLGHEVETHDYRKDPRNVQLMSHVTGQYDMIYMHKAETVSLRAMKVLRLRCAPIVYGYPDTVVTIQRSPNVLALADMAEMCIAPSQAVASALGSHAVWQHQCAGSEFYNAGEVRSKGMCFIGSTDGYPHSNRQRILNTVASAGIKMHSYNNVYGDAHNAVLNGAVVSLNICCVGECAPSDRVYKSIAAGTIVLTNEWKGMFDDGIFVDGDNILVWRNPSHLIQQVHRLAPSTLMRARLRDGMAQISHHFTPKMWAQNMLDLTKELYE